MQLTRLLKPQIKTAKKKTNKIPLKKLIQTKKTQQAAQNPAAVSATSTSFITSKKDLFITKKMNRD